MIIDLGKELLDYIAQNPNISFKYHLRDIFSGQILYAKDNNENLVSSINSALDELKVSTDIKVGIYNEISRFFRFVNARHNTGFFIENHLFSAALDNVERQLNLIKINHGRKERLSGFRVANDGLSVYTYTYKNSEVELPVEINNLFFQTNY